MGTPPCQLSDLINAIEKSIDMVAVRNLIPMKAGDVPKTWADTTLLEALTGYKPRTHLSLECIILLNGIGIIMEYEIIIACNKSLTRATLNGAT